MVDLVKATHMPVRSKADWKSSTLNPRYHVRLFMVACVVGSGFVET